MANQVPGSLLTLPSQTTDIAGFYTGVMALREYAALSAQPILAPAGLLQDQPTSEEEYAQPVPPLSLGKIVEFKDGDRPGARSPQGNILKGKVTKRGIEPLRLKEGDRLATRVNWVASNTKARGRAERLMADRVGTAAIEAGESATQLSFDGVAFFNAQHLQNPQDANSPKQPNRLQLQLTPSNLYQAKTTMRKWKAENGDPIYQGVPLDLILMVPPALEEAADKALKRSNVEEGGAALENVAQGIARKFVNPYLTDDDAWYLFVTNLGVPPLMRIVFREMMRRDKGPDSELYRDTSEIEIFSDEWTDYRLTDWRTGLKSKP